MIYKNGIFLRWNFFTILFLLFIFQKFVILKDRIIFNRDFTWMSETYSPADPNSLILMSQDVLLRHSNDISMIQKHTRSLVYSYIYRHNRFKIYSVMFESIRNMLLTKIEMQSRTVQTKTSALVNPDFQLDSLEVFDSDKKDRFATHWSAWVSLLFSMPYHVWHHIRLCL